MTTKYSVIQTSQIDGTRYLALAPEDARLVRADRSMLDAVTPAAVLDVCADGSATWERTLGCPDLPAARDAIRAARTH